MALLLWFFFVGDSFAFNSTALVDWQPERESRSAWDIIWACFSTILACTWTVIHADVPQRNTSDARVLIRFLRTYSLALFVPEVLFIIAISQFLHARSLKATCNTAQKRRDSGVASRRAGTRLITDLWSVLGGWSSMRVVQWARSGRCVRHSV